MMSASLHRFAEIGMTSGKELKVSSLKSRKNSMQQTSLALHQMLKCMLLFLKYLQRINFSIK